MNDSCPASLQNYRPFEPQELSCPHAGWVRLRKEAPVLQVNLPGSPIPVFLVTRRRELDFISQRTDLFSNQPPRGMWRWPELHEPAVAAAFAKSGHQPMNTLQASDPPQSVMYRRLIDTVLSRKGVRDLEPRINAIIRRLLEAMPAGETVDFVDAFSVPLPLLMVCLLMDFPLEDEDYLRHYTDEFALLVDPVTPTERAAQAAEVLADGYKYLERHLLGCRAHPTDSLLSAIANARFENDRPATMQEALSIAHVAVIAGNETTRNAMSSAMYILVSRPDLWQRLKADPSWVPEFVEETLRVAAPANTTPRMALADVEIGGVKVPKGSCLFMMWGSGSRDEETFSHAAQFDLERKNKRQHTTFGIGAHFCAGLHLARAELIAAVKQWLMEFDTVQFALPESEIQYAPSFAFHAFNSLPLRFSRTAGR